MHTHADVRPRVRAGSHGDVGASARVLGGGDLGVLAQALFEYAFERLLRLAARPAQASSRPIRPPSAALFLARRLAQDASNQGSSHPPGATNPWRGEPGCCAALGAPAFGRPADATRPSTKTRSSAPNQRNRSRQSQRIMAIARGPSALVPSAPRALPAVAIRVCAHRLLTFASGP